MTPVRTVSRDARAGCHDRPVSAAPQPPADETDAAALAAIRGEIARMREGLDTIEHPLQRVDGRQRSTERARPPRFYEVLVGVCEHGIHGIDDDALTELGLLHGYQRRGLNGFFTAARAGLRRAGGRVVLTPEGHRLLERHLRQIQS